MLLTIVACWFGGTVILCLWMYFSIRYHKEEHEIETPNECFISSDFDIREEE